MAVRIARRAGTSVTGKSTATTRTWAATSCSIDAGHRPAQLDRTGQAVHEHRGRILIAACHENTELQTVGSREPGHGDCWYGRARISHVNFAPSCNERGAAIRALHGPRDWPNATIVNGDAVDVVAALKEASDVPFRSDGSLSLNWALMAAGLVDLVQVTVFPVISGATGTEPIFGGAGDFDLALMASRMLDGHTEELIYRPTVH